jgi:hypothetical protein
LQIVKRPFHILKLFQDTKPFAIAEHISLAGDVYP